METLHIEEDADTGYDRIRQEKLEREIDLGERCQACLTTVGITRHVAHGLPLFECSACRCRWFDSITLMHDEAA